MFNLIRGGQTSIHSARMMTQIIKVLLFIIVFLTLAQTAFFVVKNYRDNPLVYRYGFMYFKATTYQFYAGDNKVYAYKDARGQEREITYRWVRAALQPQWAVVRDDTIGIAKRSGIISLALAGLLCVYFWRKGGSMQKRRRIRGGRIASAKELNKLALKTYGKEDERRYSIAGVHYPKDAETLHTLIVGSTGAGKTVAMTDIVGQIEANGDKAIIYDKLGSYIPHFYKSQRDFILNPYDNRSHDWDIFQEAREEVDFETMAAALIPRFKDTADPFWVNSARQLFASGAAAFWKAGNEDMGALCDLLLKADLKELAKEMEDTVAQSIVDPGQSKTALSVRSILTTHLRPLAMLHRVYDPFSVRDWVQNDRPGFLFLSSDASTHETRRAMIATQIELAIVALLSLPPSQTRRVWFIIDELPTLHQIPSLTSGLRESRQFGGSFVLGTQVVSELRDIYGREEAETISGNCNTRLVLNSPDWQTAQWLSNSLGRSMVERTKEGLSFGASEIRDGVNISSHEEINPLVLPSELQVLPNLHGYIKMPRDLPVAKIILQPKTRPPVEETIIPPKKKKTPKKQPPAEASATNKQPATAKASTPAPNEDWTGVDPSGPPPHITDVPPPESPPPSSQSAKKTKNQPPRQHDLPFGDESKFAPPGQAPTEGKDAPTPPKGNGESKLNGKATSTKKPASARQKLDPQSPDLKPQVNNKRPHKQADATQTSDLNSKDDGNGTLNVTSHELKGNL